MTTYSGLPARRTTYNGIAMRSRLEARFAAYLDRHGWEWEYESRAYASTDGQYLPDFEIHKLGRRLFVEVRPDREGACRAFDQMPIIWASVPNALLMIVTPDCVYEATLEERGWALTRATWDES